MAFVFSGFGPVDIHVGTLHAMREGRLDECSVHHSEAVGDVVLHAVTIDFHPDSDTYVSVFNEDYDFHFCTTQRMP